MEYKDYIKQGLNGNAPLKLILCGNIQEMENDKVGVVSVVYATWTYVNTLDTKS